MTDSVAQVPFDPPALNKAENLLLVSKQSTADTMPSDTVSARKTGWEKTALLVSYFFPEHEELLVSRPGVVEWTEGWHDNFLALAGRLIVPPVVRTLLYAQNPLQVGLWVNRVTDRFDFVRIVPAHWEAPILAKPVDLRGAFRFLEDEAADAFPEKDMERGLKPLADFAFRSLRRN